MTTPIDLSVIGGYLGAGKTTVLNHVIGHAGRRRLAVVVNDFGELGIDAELLANTSGRDGIVGLPNGCVCCTLGTGLQDALGTLAGLAPPPDQVIIEASGVADPAAVAAWGHTPRFRPAGVIVVVSAVDIRRQVDDRLIGTTVRRQLAGADLLLVTKSDLAGAVATTSVTEWLASIESAPVIVIDGGVVEPQLVLGVDARPGADRSAPASHPQYRTSSWQTQEAVDRDRLDDFLAGLDPRILRLKGWVAITDGSTLEVQLVGRRHTVRSSDALPGGSRLAAIWLAPDVDDPWPALAG